MQIIIFVITAIITALLGAQIKRVVSGLFA